MKQNFRKNIQLTKVNKILSKRETIYFNSLSNVLNKNKALLPNVSMKKIIKNAPNTKMHFDFVFTDYYQEKEYVYYNYKYILELDDATHNSQNAKERDERKNQICKNNNIHLLRLKI